MTLLVSIVAMELVVLGYAEGVDGHNEHLVLVVATISTDVHRDVLALVGLPVKLDFKPVVAQATFAHRVVGIAK